MKKKCELCKNAASMHCDSDRASLCWDCDSRVHMVNFLVAKHTRTLLCRACQSPTSWTGSGPKLCPTISVCDTCIRLGNGKMEDDEMDDGKGDDDNNDDDGDDDDNNNDDGDDDDDGENQVVPSSPPPSLAMTLSESGECSSKRADSGFRWFGAKTTVENRRFPNNTGYRPEENENSSQKLRPWSWR